MIPANQKEYQKAFFYHKRAIEKAEEVERRTNSAPYNMLLFYAVECGLYALQNIDDDNPVERRWPSTRRASTKKPTKTTEGDSTRRAPTKKPTKTTEGDSTSEKKHDDDDNPVERRGLSKKKPTDDKKHDLVGMMNKITITNRDHLMPANLEGGKEHKFVLRSDKKRTPPRLWELSEIHQAWRYGVAVNPDHEKEIVAWLLRICEYIEGRNFKKQSRSSIENGR